MAKDAHRGPGSARSYCYTVVTSVKEPFILSSPSPGRFCRHLRHSLQTRAENRAERDTVRTSMNKARLLSQRARQVMIHVFNFALEVHNFLFDAVTACTRRVRRRKSQYQLITSEAVQSEVLPGEVSDRFKGDAEWKVQGFHLHVAPTDAQGALDMMQSDTVLGDFFKPVSLLDLSSSFKVVGYPSDPL